MMLLERRGNSGAMTDDAAPINVDVMLIVSDMSTNDDDIVFKLA